MPNFVLLIYFNQVFEISICIYDKIEIVLIDEENFKTCREATDFINNKH